MSANFFQYTALTDGLNDPRSLFFPLNGFPFRSILALAKFAFFTSTPTQIYFLYEKLFFIFAEKRNSLKREGKCRESNLIYIQ